MTLLKSLLIIILGCIILRYTNTKIGDVVGLIGIVVGVLWIVVNEIRLHRGE